MTVCLYTQWCGVGPCDESEIQSDLAWLPIISSETSVFKNTSVQQGQAVLHDGSEGLLLGTSFWDPSELTHIVSPLSLLKGPCCWPLHQRPSSSPPGFGSQAL